MHLANTDINKYNKKYVYPKHANDESANIWSITTYQKYLNKNNIDWNSILNKIKDIIIKTIISAYGELVNSLIKIILMIEVFIIYLVLIFKSQINLSQYY